MKLLPAIVALLSIAAPTFAQEPPAIKTQNEKASYSIGVEMGSNMKQQKLDIDPELLARGFRDAYSGKPTALSEEEMQSAVSAFEKELQARMEKEAQDLPERNKKEGAAFLAENKKKEGVKTLPSGLQYKVIKEGSGPTPKADDQVTTHYRGTLIDGTEFDSSYKRNEPTSFGVNQVIQGWQEALQLMKTGSKWQLFIPSHLAYGESGAGRAIGPNATLIFDIELISIDKQ